MALNVIPAGKIATDQLCYHSPQQDHEVWLQLYPLLESISSFQRSDKIGVKPSRALFHFRVKLHSSPNKPESMLRLTFSYWKEFYIHGRPSQA